MRNKKIVHVIIIPFLILVGFCFIMIYKSFQQNLQFKGADTVIDTEKDSLYIRNSTSETLTDVETDQISNEAEKHTGFYPYFGISKSAECMTDNEYIQKREKTESNIELSLLNDEYADIWKEKIEFYYQKIIEHYISDGNTEMLEKSKDMQEEWEEYCEKQINYNTDLLHDTYDPGSIVPILISDYNRMIYRDRAIELYLLCANLPLSIEAP